MHIMLLSLALLFPPTASVTVVEEETFQQLTDTGLTYSITIKAILPDGSHAVLFCGEEEKEGCGEVQLLPPEKLPPRDKRCSSESTKQMGYVNICKFKDVGDFAYKRDGDKVTIFHRKGKTAFKITSSW